MSDKIVEDIIGERHERYEHQQHGGYVDHEFHAGGRARRDGVEEVAVGASLVLDGGYPVCRRLGLRTENLGDDNRSGRCHHGRREQMRGEQNFRGRVRTAQHTDIGAHHRARDSPHAGYHHQENLRAVHGGQVVLDKHGRLAHAHEDVAGGNQPFRPRYVHEFTQQPRDAAYYLLNNPPMVKHRYQGGEEDDDGQRVDEEAEPASLRCVRTQQEA